MQVIYFVVNSSWEKCFLGNSLLHLYFLFIESDTDEQPEYTDDDRENAAILIQRSFREMKLNCEKEDAAFKIQTAFRDMKERKRREEAAIKIQRAFRNMKARKGSSQDTGCV